MAACTRRCRPRLPTVGGLGLAPKLGPLLRDPRAQVLAVTFGIVLVLIAMVMLNVAGLAAVWENGHWTVASIGATAEAVIGARRATGLFAPTLPFRSGCAPSAPSSGTSRP